MTNNQQSRGVRQKSCSKCGGDAIIDLLESEWRCLQCGKTLMRYTPVASDWSSMVRTIRQAETKRNDAQLVTRD